MRFSFISILSFSFVAHFYLLFVFVVVAVVVIVLFIVFVRSHFRNPFRLSIVFRFVYSFRPSGNSVRRIFPRAFSFHKLTILLTTPLTRQASISLIGEIHTRAKKNYSIFQANQLTPQRTRNIIATTTNTESSGEKDCK